MLPVESVIVHDDRHEITVSCGGEDYLITESDFLSLGISESGEVDCEKLSFAAEKLSCIKKAQSYLSNGDLSVRKLTEKLKAKFVEEIISPVITLFIDKGYLDDARLAEQWTDELAEKRRWGKIRIKNYLYEKGFAREDITAALENADEAMFAENLVFLIKREAGSSKYDISDKKSTAKLCNFLFRTGYSWDEIRPALAEYTKEQSCQ